MENQKNKIMEEIRETISPEMKMRTEMSVAIANRIYDIMASKGLSQKDLAKRMGKTETEVSSWLSGTLKMPPSMIHKISSALNEDIMEDIVEDVNVNLTSLAQAKEEVLGPIVKAQIDKNT